MLAEEKGDNRVQDDPRWLLVHRVVQSETFARAPRLAEFLTFVSERTLTGQVSSINEQEIGVWVFGRESGYLQSDDNIVRVNASRLRQRLDEYFSSEGTRETLRISLPKGRYIPEFVEVAIDPLETAQTHPPTDVPALEESPSNALPQKPHRTATLWVIAVSLLCLVGLLLVALHVRSVTSPRPGKAPLSSGPFWTPFLSGESPAVVVPADSSLIIYERLTHTTVGLPEYINGSYRTANGNGREDPGDARSLSQRRTTSLADLSFVTTLQRMPDAANGHTKITFARDLRIHDLQSSNAILLGGRASNPWVALYDSQRHFSLKEDENTRIYTIRNDSPSVHDFDVLRFQAQDPQYLAYALVAYVPNQDTKHSVLILEGTTESGTQAAIDFIFNSEQLNGLLSEHRRPDGSLPYFEFVLESDAFSGKSPGARILAQRFF